jgi:sulfur-oxidizing protein SoxY
LPTLAAGSGTAKLLLRKEGGHRKIRRCGLCKDGRPLENQAMSLRGAKPTFAALALLAGLGATADALAQSEDAWRSFRSDVFGERPIQENSSVMQLTVPSRAEDAALVPVELRAALPPDDPRTIARITLIVDQNPAPVAASFRLGPDRREANLSTRLRVDAYSFVRAVAETSDGELHMTARYVKAAGGCSAPALKDQDESLAKLGEMRLRTLASLGESTPGHSRAQLMVRHPNYSGLQMNQITRHYIPAKFVDHIVVMQGNELVFEMEGGISLSEDPVIGFDYKANGGTLHVRAKDTDGRVFETRASGNERSPS